MLLGALLNGCATVGTAPPPEGGTPPSAPAPEVPSLGFFSKIKVPDGQRPALRLSAKGVQVFRCEARGKESHWVFRLPEAELTDGTGKVVARHGVNFSFEHLDGSRLIGRVVSYDDADSRDNLLWLLIATHSYGDGAFAGVDYVQRVNTRGGMPPEKCESNQRNQLLRVDFSADFVFYRPG